MDEEQQINFLRKLIQCKSITPDTEEAIDLIIEELSKAKFVCEKLVFSDDKGEKVTNLYAWYGSGEKNLCFAGHVDVVPVGDEKSWERDPFEGVIEGNALYGRGAVDMKTGVVAGISAAFRYIKDNPDASKYRISFLISGDEEWGSKYGTIKVLQWLKENNHEITACIIGEPTSRKVIGDTIKNGSRGSILFDLEVKGKQGHVAYHEYASNPITVLVNILHELKKVKLDAGTKFFEPSNLEITSIDVGNIANNVIPSTAKANFCIRFNDKHSESSLKEWVRSVIEKYAEEYSLDHILSGEAYLVQNEHLIGIVQESIKESLDIEPIISAGGATSDARFIKNVCPVIELGPLREMAHKVDEHVNIRDVFALSNAYHRIIEKFYNSLPAGELDACAKELLYQLSEV